MGMALQTVTKHGEVGTDIRSQFIPDPGYVFLEPDQSGAEARVVAILAKDAKLLKIFEYNLDLHRITYAWVKSIAPDGLLNEFFIEKDIGLCRLLADKITKILKEAINVEDRQLGKKGRHAANYDMGKHVASILFGCSEWRAGQILDKIHTTNANIRGVFHTEVQEALKADRRLVNPFNRDRVFLDKWGSELFKEAYAQIPQSTVSDQTKFAAIRIERRLPYVQILAESHDSFLSQVPINKVDESIRVFKEEFESPIDFSNCSLKRGTLIIPCEIVMGDKNWEIMKHVA
jgi:DNA polymerase I-like protein with 3'-5' exonuclease and polymerase domains